MENISVYYKIMLTNRTRKDWPLGLAARKLNDKKQNNFYTLFYPKEFE